MNKKYFNINDLKLIENIFLLICLFFIIWLLSTVYCMGFLNKNSNETIV
jgi:hypothetical protein